MTNSSDIDKIYYLDATKQYVKTVDGREYVMAKAAVELPPTALCKWIDRQARTVEIIRASEVMSEGGVELAGVNATGKTVPVGHWFWMCAKGVVKNEFYTIEA